MKLVVLIILFKVMLNVMLRIMLQLKILIIPLNICSEASDTEGNSVQVDKNVGVAVATSVSSIFGPAGLSSSAVPAEVAVSPEPSGARKILYTEK